MKAKTCPWCNAAAEIEPWHGGGPEKRLVSCSDESCEVSPAVTGETEDEALEKWNDRTGEGHEKELVEVKP